MSTRTIIEINHDCLRRLAADPAGLARFVEALGLTDRQHRAENTPNGIRILGERHHSETLMLEVK